MEGGSGRDLIVRLGIGHSGALLFGAVWLAAAVWWARRQKVPAWGWAGAMGVGAVIAAAWWFTYAVTQVAFDTHPIQALSFTGPSAEVLTIPAGVQERRSGDVSRRYSRLGEPVSRVRTSRCTCSTNS